MLAAALFSLVASAVYVMNDLADAERDRHHPLKRRTRPVAAGQISVGAARQLMAVVFAAAAVGAALMPGVALPLAVYVALNVAYSHWLKHVPVVDLFCISAGFMTRVWAGALAVAVPLSSWMVITTMALTLYLAAVKRRLELAASGVDGRSVLRTYSAPLLDQYAQTAAVATILFYSLYIIEVRPALVISVPLVLFGIFRYWYTVQHVGGPESPVDALWHDLPLAVTILAWGGVCLYTLTS
jgi:4-hydroxybenzoate polyprenyltransferase